MDDGIKMKNAAFSLCFVTLLLSSLSILAGVNRTIGANYSIAGKRPSPSENIAWTPNGTVVCIAPGFQNVPQIVSDGVGGAIIAWFDNRTGTDIDIYAQHLNSAGVAQWGGDYGIPICKELHDQSDVKVISDGVGGAIIVWQDYRNG